MILDSKFEQLVQRNFLRSSQEYDLAKYFWTKAERAMQQKPTQQPTLTTKSLPEDKGTYVTDELAKYFAGFAWTIPRWVQDRESDERDYVNYIKDHRFNRSELQSIQANNRKLIQVIQEDIDCSYSKIAGFTKAKRVIKDINALDAQGNDHYNAYCEHYTERIRELENKISSSKLKLKKLVALQTKVKRLLAE